MTDETLRQDKLKNLTKPIHPSTFILPPQKLQCILNILQNDLEKKLDPSTYGNITIFSAIFHNNEVLFNTLLSYKSVIKSISAMNNFAFFQSACRGNINMFLKLLQYPDVVKNIAIEFYPGAYESTSALECARQNGHSKIKSIINELVEINKLFKSEISIENQQNIKNKIQILKHELKNTSLRSEEISKIFLSTHKAMGCQNQNSENSESCQFLYKYVKENYSNNFRKNLYNNRTYHDVNILTLIH